MFLTVCASSTDASLTTTSAVKEALFGAGATTTVHDARISGLIERMSAWAESFVGQPLTVQSYSETLAGYGSPELMLGRVPVRAVDRVYDATDTGEATQLLSSQYRLDREAGFLERAAGFGWTARTNQDFAANPIPGSEERPWLVDYRAGWTHGGLATDSPNWSTEKGTTSTGRTLPYDVEEAVVQRVVRQFQGQDAIESERIGDLSVNYRSVGVDGRPDPAQRILMRFRRWA